MFPAETVKLNVVRYQTGHKLPNRFNISGNLLPSWELQTYILSFNANGGNCSDSSRKVVYGANYGNLPTPTKSDYTFAGWYTTITGGTQVNNTTKMGNENITVFAHWNPAIHTSTLTAQGNGTIQFTTSNGSGGWYSLVRTQGTSLNLSGYNYIKIIAESSPAPSEYGIITINGTNYTTEDYIGSTFVLSDKNVSFAAFRYDNTGGPYIDSSVTIQYWK